MTTATLARIATFEPGDPERQIDKAPLESWTVAIAPGSPAVPGRGQAG